MIIIEIIVLMIVFSYRHPCTPLFTLQLNNYNNKDNPRNNYLIEGELRVSKG